MSILSMITWILTAVCWCFVFKKAGIAPWKAFIPYYSDYQRFGLAGKKLLYFPFLILTITETIVSIIYVALNALDFMDEFYEDLNLQLDLTVLNSGKCLLTIAIYAISIWIGIRIAAKFGKGKWFGAGLGLLPIIFAPILAFDKSKFSEAEEI